MGDVLAVVAPAGALGGIPMLCAYARGIPVIAVRENACILDVTAARLDLPEVIEVDNYLEACGVVTALQAGISLDSIRRPFKAFAPRQRAPAARRDGVRGEEP